MKVLKYVIRGLAIGSYLLIFAAVLLLSPVLFGKRPMIVMSGSMRPTFLEGSLIYMEKSGFDDVKVGDIVCYGREQIVSHRVVGKMEQIQSLLTRGDANESIDPEVTADMVIGKVWEGVYITYAGYVMQLLRRPETILVLASVLVADIAVRYWVENVGGEEIKETTL